MKFENYSVLDFVRNEEFQKWVNSPDGKSDFFWESWMQNHEDKKHLVMEAREILMSIDFPAEKASRAEMDEVFEKVLKNEHPVLLGKIEAEEKKRFNRIKRAFSVAASLIIVSVFGFIILDLIKNKPTPKNTTLLKEIIKENPSGRKTTFRLPDGSLIKLNALSKLVVSDSFGIEKREVYLEGEAFFEISKNKNKPFIVHTGNVSTFVTGTTFNINAYKEDTNIQIAVLEGNVKTILHNESGNDTLTLQKSDMATFNKQTKQLYKTTFNYLETMGWKDGIIYFKNIDSKQAFDYLERWYGVDIQVINGTQIPGSFYGEFRNETLINVLNAMGRALQFEFQINNKFVLIKPKNINENE